MAGEWIKMRTNLWNDPRVSQLCDATGCSEAAIVGGLYWLWSTADEHTETGTMPGLSINAIDRKTSIQGFGAALVAVGWLADHPEGVRLTRFEEHNGASAKARAQTAKRVANHKGNAKVTQQALPERQDTVSDALPREEKRREEKELEQKQDQPRVNDDSASPIPAQAASAVGSLCVAMRSAGVETQPADPRMIALAAQGVLPETVAAACAEAKKSKPGERITPGYVLAILSRWSTQAAALDVGGATQPRAGPGYQTANEKSKDFADRLTGKTRRHEPAAEFIDLNARPA